MRRRVSVIGTSGAGKTTLARTLAKQMDAPHIEMDALFHGPNWTEAPTDVFRARVADAIAADSWTIDGNYSAARDLIWARADTVIWLDYAFPLVFGRLLRRTLRRCWTREALWNGNRESFVTAFFTRDSLLLWAAQTHRKRQREFPALLAEFAAGRMDRTALRFRSPRETQAWLDSISR